MKINDIFVELFDAAESTITISGSQIDRINDGMVVESVYSGVKATFECTNLLWSVTALQYTVFDSYAAPSVGVREYHRFTLTALDTVPYLWLKFNSTVYYSTVVEIPKAKFTEDIAIAYAIGQNNISMKGEAMKDPNHPLIIFDLPTGCLVR